MSRFEWRVTFDPKQPMPRWPGAHPAGWLTIVAKDEVTAFRAAHRMLGDSFSRLEPVSEVVDWEGLYPLGELGRVRAPLHENW